MDWGSECELKTRSGPRPSLSFTQPWLHFPKPSPLQWRHKCIYPIEVHLRPDEENHQITPRKKKKHKHGLITNVLIRIPPLAWEMSGVQVDMCTCIGGGVSTQVLNVMSFGCPRFFFQYGLSSSPSTTVNFSAFQPFIFSTLPSIPIF